MKKEYDIESPLRPQQKERKINPKIENDHQDDEEYNQLMEIENIIKFKEKIEKLKDKDTQNMFSELLTALINKEKMKAQYLQKLLSENEGTSFFLNFLFRFD